MAHRSVPLVVALAALVWPAACPAPPSSAPVYHRDIAPLFAEHCVQCHQDGGIAPFPLVTYADAQANAENAAIFVSARLMPPMTVDNSGACRSYQDARWLTDAEIALIVAWADAGAPEGAPPDTALPIDPPDALGDANLFVEMDRPYTPKGNAEFPNDDYRCFFLDGPDADAYVNGFEIVAGQPQEVHHMLLLATLTAEAEQAAQDLDDDDADPGWQCFSTPIEEDISLIAGWAPGKNVMRYPEGTGLLVPAGRKLIMQIHYNLLAGPGVPDLTALKLRTVATVTKEGALFPVVDTDLQIPPGDPAAKFAFSIPLAGLSEDLDVHGVFPHMHQLGRTLRFELQPLGDTDPADAYCMAHVPRWDFNWQELFLYERPIRMTANDVLKVECTYDTSSRSAPVFWGEGTQDEMCLVFMYVTRTGGGPLSELFDDF
jgi:mono/diheme cytochrome c family protein